MFYVPYSAERTRLVEVLDHFFRQRPVDSDDDDGDHSKTLDCWELKDPLGPLRGPPYGHCIPQIWSSVGHSKVTSRIHNI